MSETNRLASTLENGIDIEDTPENQSRIRTRKRLQRRQKQKLKSLLDKKNISQNEQDKSTAAIIEPFLSQKNYYSNYMELDDVIKGLESGELFEGNIRISQKCTIEAYVPSPDKSKDILINSIKSRNRALDGDKVAVKILQKSEWRVFYLIF